MFRVVQIKKRVIKKLLYEENSFGVVRCEMYIEIFLEWNNQAPTDQMMDLAVCRPVLKMFQDQRIIRHVEKKTNRRYEVSFNLLVESGSVSSDDKSASRLLDISANQLRLPFYMEAYCWKPLVGKQQPSRIQQFSENTFPLKEEATDRDLSNNASKPNDVEEGAKQKTTVRSFFSKLPIRIRGFFWSSNDASNRSETANTTQNTKASKIPVPIKKDAKVVDRRVSSATESIRKNVKVNAEGRNAKRQIPVPRRTLGRVVAEQNEAFNDTINYHQHQRFPEYQPKKYATRNAREEQITSPFQGNLLPDVAKASTRPQPLRATVPFPDSTFKLPGINGQTAVVSPMKIKSRNYTESCPKLPPIGNKMPLIQMREERRPRPNSFSPNDGEYGNNQILSPDTEVSPAVPKDMWRKMKHISDDQRRIHDQVNARTMNHLSTIMKKSANSDSVDLKSEVSRPSLPRKLPPMRFETVDHITSPNESVLLPGSPYTPFSGRDAPLSALSRPATALSWRQMPLMGSNGSDSPLIYTPNCLESANQIPSPLAGVEQWQRDISRPTTCENSRSRCERNITSNASNYHTETPESDCQPSEAGNRSSRIPVRIKGFFWRPDEEDKVYHTPRWDRQSTSKLPVPVRRPPVFLPEEYVIPKKISQKDAPVKKPKDKKKKKRKKDRSQRKKKEKREDQLMDYQNKPVQDVQTVRKKERRNKSSPREAPVDIESEPDKTHTLPRIVIKLPSMRDAYEEERKLKEARSMDRRHIKKETRYSQLCPKLPSVSGNLPSVIGNLPPINNSRKGHRKITANLVMQEQDDQTRSELYRLSPPMEDDFRCGSVSSDEEFFPKLPAIF